jgi:hypothetical protein
MTLKELETLIDDTIKTPRATDKVALATSLGVLEIARQLMMLNERLAGDKTLPAGTSGRRKK